MSVRWRAHGVAIAILAFAAGMILLLWGAVLLKIRAEHKADLQDAARHTANLARAVEEHAVRSFREADQVLLFLRHQYGHFGRKLDPGAMLEEGAILSKFFTALGIVDENGELILSSRPFPPINLADRDYFHVHAAGDGADRPYISEPVQSRVSGERLLQMSRRINTPDGRFGGVAVLSINPEYFATFYGQLDIGARGMATLVGRDRVVRAQRAGSRLSAAAPVASDWAVFRQLQTADSGGYASASAVDGERRTFSYRALKEYDLVAVVGVLEREVLADFFQRRRVYFLSAALVSAVIVVMTALLLLLTARQARMSRDLAQQNAGLVQAEHALAASEARLRATLDNTPGVAVQWYDREGRVLYWNAASARLYGIDALQAQGKRSDELFHTGEQREEFRRALAALESSGPPEEPAERSLRRRDGAERTVLYTRFVLPGRDAAPVFVCMEVDITERKHAEESLRTSQQRFETLFRSSPVPSRIFTDVGGRTLDCNAAFCVLVGRTREELLGRAGKEVGLFADGEVARTIGQRLRADRGIEGEELDMLTPGGERRRVSMTALPLAWQGEEAWITQYVDITERQKSEQALRASEQRFAALFHNSLVPQAVSNPDSRLAEDVNQAFLDLVGYTREQMLGARGTELGLYWDTEDTAKVVRIIEQRGTLTPEEVRLRRADGSQRVALVTAVPIETAGGPRIAWSLVDVTEQRAARREVEELNESLERTVAWRTEELSRANEELKAALEHLKTSQDALLQSERLAALGRLVAGVAHELNTPIGNSLLSASTLAERTRHFAAEARTGSLKRSTLAEYVADTSEASGILERNLERAAELIRSFKQVAADQTSSQRRSFALREIVDEVLLAHRPTLRQSPIEIRTEIPPGIRLDSYPGPLGQVLGNLVTNAVLHGFDGRATGSVSISAQVEGDGSVEIAVRDDGRGISEANLLHVFDPFFTTRLGRGGTGLGLAICHRIVTENLGGQMRVTSRLEQGSTFLVRIPLNAPAVQGRQAA